MLEVTEMPERPLIDRADTAEQVRLDEVREKGVPWKQWVTAHATSLETRFTLRPHLVARIDRLGSEELRV